MRDMIQNHLMQLMSFIAMESPSIFEPEPIRDEIVKVFRSIRPYTVLIWIRWLSADNISVIGKRRT